MQRIKLMFLDFLFRKRPKTEGLYKMSRHANKYEELAEQFKVTPDRVYDLAHGDKPKTDADFDVIRELKNAQILE